MGKGMIGGDGGRGERRDESRIAMMEEGIVWRRE